MDLRTSSYPQMLTDKDQLLVHSSASAHPVTMQATACQQTLQTVFVNMLFYCLTPYDHNINLQIKSPTKSSTFKHRTETEVRLETVLQEAAHTGFQKHFKCLQLLTRV